MRNRRLNLIIAVIAAALALLAGACGDGSDAADGHGHDDKDEHHAQAVRAVEVDMADIAFRPDTVRVRAGETVEFVFTNSGKLTHDAFIGTVEAQADHEAEMRKAGPNHDGEHAHNEGDDAVTVEPGKTGRLTYTFDKAGTLEIGCHQPGHYGAGMKVAVEVAA